jgi:thiamine biosynthesis protein ThiI
VKRSILLHYHEINLKKSNRGWFENCLLQHAEQVLHDLPHDGVRKFAGRMLVSLVPESPVDEFVQRLRRMFGVANFAVTWEVPASMEAIRPALEKLVLERTFRSFKIDARRGTKDFALNSQQINENLGAFVRGLTGAGVRMEDPELTCFVEIAGPRAFLYFEKIPAAGGLPSRTGGRVMCLLSGGIDSPVAAYRLMRRGCQVLFVHFHSFPDTTLESQQKVRRIVQILAGYQLDSRLHLVPFADLQREIVAYAPPPLRVILYRRFMLRIAGILATRERASALVTGDSLGQVASQTLENLRVVSAVTDLPIFRPLIGDDKEDIMNSARQIGTYSISILPDQDCCTMFVPRHPETMASMERVEEAESALDVERLVTSALAAAARETIAPAYLSSGAPV